MLLAVRKCDGVADDWGAASGVEVECMECVCSCDDQVTSLNKRQIFSYGNYC